MPNRIKRILFLMTGILSVIFLFACNSQQPANETELKFFNPNPFGTDVDSIQVTVKYGSKEIRLFEGRKAKPGFEGPWSTVVTDYNGESLDLNIQTFGSNNARLNDISIIYKNVGGRLAQDTSVYFVQKAIAANLKDNTLALNWVVLPVGNSRTPVLTSSNPNILSIVDTKTAKMLDTGKVEVYIRLDSTRFADTLKVQIYSGTVIPNPAFPDSIRFVTDSVKLVVGITDYPLVWTIYPRLFSGTVSCKTDAAAIIQLTGHAAITPIAPGQGKVICSIDGTLLADTLTVNIPTTAPGAALDSIRFTEKSVTLYVGGASVKPAYTIYPSTANPILAWSISTGIAKLDSTGTLTPLSAGTATVSVFAAGVVKDMLQLTVVDTSKAAYARWSVDTVKATVSEGGTVAVDLIESIVNPNVGIYEIAKGRLSAEATLAVGKYEFKAGIRDSGNFYDILIVKQGGFSDSVIVHVKVNPVYVGLTLLPTTNGTFTAAPVKTKYRLGDTVTVTATPAAGYGFSAWTGGGSSLSNPLALVMDTDKSLKADFQLLAVLGCVDVAAGESLNANLRKIYASTAKKGTLCPAQGARFENLTIQVIGKVQFIIR